MKGSVIARNDSDEAIYVKYKKISMELKRYKLGEIGEIRMCKRILKEETNSVGGVPFFKIGTFGGQADVFITKEKFEEYKNAYSYPKKGDVLISAAGTIGRTVVFDGKDAYFQDSNIVWIENDESKVLNEYLFYCYKNIRWTTSVGSTILRLYNDDIRNTDIIVPPLSEQKKIASVLSALDDKIALNKKMNQKLEAMAKRLYDYWFVQYDFPDKNGHPYKTTGGPMTYNPTLKREIPVGWEVSNICPLMEILPGGTPSKAKPEYWNGEIPFFGPTDYCGDVFQLSTEEHITENGLNNCASALYPPKTIFITARGSVGKLIVCGKPMAMNQSCYALKPFDLEKYEYLFYLTKQLIEQLKKKGSGSVFKSINTLDIEQSFLSIAPNEIIDLYCKKVKSIFDRIKSNTIEISKLTTLRNKLLPLLMNGQLVVD